MSALSSLLVQDQVLTVNQVEQALQRQVIFGGDLVTNLLELGLVNEDVLVGYVARVMRQPALPRAALETVDPAALSRLPAGLAEERRVLPVRLRNGEMVVACAAPPPAEVVDELAAAAGAGISVHLTLEFRLAMALNRHFGTRIPARLAGLQKRYAPDFEPRPAPGPDTPAAPPAPIPDPPSAPPAEAPIVVESAGPGKRSEESTIRFITRHAEREVTTPFGHRQAPAPAVPAVVPPPPAQATERSRRISFSEAVSEVRAAGSRDDILTILFDFARQAFDFSALFLVHGGAVQGRVSALRDGPVTDLEHVTASLDGGMFHTVHETRGVHLGPPGESAEDAELFARLGRERPTNCAVIPIALRQRIILMLYGDSGDAGVRANRVTRLADFGREISAAFERILLAQKLGRFHHAPDAGGPRARVDERDAPKKPPVAKSDLASYLAKEPPITPSLVPVGKARLQPPAAPATDLAAALDTDSWPAPAATPARPPEPAPEPVAEPVATEPLPPQDDFTTRATEPAIVVSPSGAARAAFDPARRPAADLLSRVDVLDVSPDYRTSDREEPFRTPAVPPVAAPQRSVVVDMGEEIERLIERVLDRGRFAADGSLDEEAAEILVGIGDDALARLIRHFPGPLVHDRYRDPNRVRPVTGFGPLLALLARFGDRAVPHLLALTESYDSEVRYFSIFLFTAIPHPLALPALVRRVFDNDRQIRRLAVDVIDGMEAFPEYRWAVQDLTAALAGTASTLERKRLAAEALGRLQAPFAVKALAEMLGSVDGVLAELCQRALVLTTFNDFGFSERRWLTWWQANRDRHRMEWAIEAVNHRREDIRNHAVETLRQSIGDAIPWPAGPLDHRQRKEIRRLAEEWWAHGGRALHPPPDAG